MQLMKIEAMMKGYKKLRGTKSGEDFIEVKLLVHPHDAHESFAMIPLGANLELTVSTSDPVLQGGAVSDTSPKREGGDYLEIEAI